MSSSSLLLVVLGAGLGTYLIRSLSLVWGSQARWPGWLGEWLSFVSPAILGALVGPALLLPHGTLIAPWQNGALLAAVPTVAAAWVWRNLLLTVLVGVVAFALIGWVVA